MLSFLQDYAPVNVNPPPPPNPGKAGTLAGQNPTCDIRNCPGMRGLGRDFLLRYRKRGNKSAEGWSEELCCDETGTKPKT